MKITTTRPPASFKPVTLSITFESQQELDALTAVAARTKKIPEAMFHEERFSKSVESLLARGIDEETIAGALGSLRDVLLGAGGKP
jgi:hypothetical protein